MKNVRNELLSRSDWRVVSDAPWDTEAWRTYRQTLRDFPATWVPAQIVLFTMSSCVCDRMQDSLMYLYFLLVWGLSPVFFFYIAQLFVRAAHHMRDEDTRQLRKWYETLTRDL